MTNIQYGIISNILQQQASKGSTVNPNTTQNEETIANNDYNSSHFYNVLEIFKWWLSPNYDFNNKHLLL